MVNEMMPWRPLGQPFLLRSYDHVDNTELIFLSLLSHTHLPVSPFSSYVLSSSVTSSWVLYLSVWVGWKGEGIFQLEFKPCDPPLPFHPAALEVLDFGSANNYKISPMF